MELTQKCSSCFKPGGMLYPYRGTSAYYCRECYQDCVNGDAATTQLAAYLAPIFKAWLDFHEGRDVIGETRQQRASSIELAVAEALEDLGDA
jgi:hypothetical protein